jgi:hypothetical protein
MAVIQHASAAQVFSSGTTGTATATFGTAVTAGNCLVACMTSPSASAAVTSVTAVKTGALAESWTQSEHVSDATSGIYAAVWTNLGTGGGGTAVNVTVSFGQTDSGSVQTPFLLDVYEVSGVTAVDKIAVSAAGATGTSWSSGATATTAQASEIAFGVASCTPTASGTATVTGPGGAWTNSTVLTQAWTSTFGSYHAYQVSGYEALSSTGTVTYSGTVSASSYWDAAVVTLKVTSSADHPGAASLTGSGTLTAGAVVSVPRGAALAGTGTLTVAATAGIPSAAALTGAGTLTAGAAVTAIGQGSASLNGTGTLTIAGGLGWSAAAALNGTGALAAGYTGLMLQSAALSGDGTLTVAGAAGLRFTAGLSGAGFLSVPQVAGGLVNGVGGAATPQALPGSSQVAVAPPGSSNWQWLGTLGQVTALTYSFTCPGGADKMTCTIQVPASYRTQLFNPGWQVKIVRGGHQVWAGKLDEPQPSPHGWTLTAVGNGNRGTDFLAVYSGTWPAGQPDAAVNAAIARGLPWANPGIGTPSGIWLGQSVDSGAQTITGLLNLVTSRGGLTWYVNSQPGGAYAADDLSVFPLPTVPNRLLIATTPVGRTLGADVNTIYIRYQSGADNAATGTTATYATVTAVNAQSVAAHGTLEQYIDISDAGTLTSAAAQAVGANALQLFQRASFAGPFQASYGQLLNIGGAPVDPGTDQASTMVRMLLYDYGLGGEVSPVPITWIVGAYEWDDFKMVATLTPMQVLDQSLSSLLSAAHASVMPVTVAST